MKNIKVSFIAREFCIGDRTETTVRGYEPAIIKTEKGIQLGRVIDPNRLEQAEFTDWIYFQTILPLAKSETDLIEILQQGGGGKKWLEKHRKYFQDTFGEEIPMIFRINELELPPRLDYVLYPEDYFKRIEKMGFDKYSCPKGVVECLPETLVYWRILPPMRFKNGKSIPNLYYKRQVQDSRGIFNKYFLTTPSKDHFGDVAPGVLLGKLNEEDLKNKEYDFEQCFPIEHFLEVVYPVSLRQAGSYNPLTIRVDLVP